MASGEFPVRPASATFLRTCVESVKQKFGAHRNKQMWGASNEPECKDFSWTKLAIPVTIHFQNVRRDRARRRNEAAHILEADDRIQARRVTI